MTLCNDCEFSDLCIVFRTRDDYIDSSGRFNEIIGCNPDQYIFKEKVKQERGI